MFTLHLLAVGGDGVMRMNMCDQSIFESELLFALNARY